VAENIQSSGWYPAPPRGHLELGSDDNSWVIFNIKQRFCPVITRRGIIRHGRKGFVKISEIIEMKNFPEVVLAGNQERGT
jgi:hypothetical protein